MSAPSSDGAAAPLPALPPPRIVWRSKASAGILAVPTGAGSGSGIVQTPAGAAGGTGAAAATSVSGIAPVEAAALAGADGIVFSKDGARAAALFADAVTVLASTPGGEAPFAQRVRLPVANVTAAAFSPAGTYLLTWARKREDERTCIPRPPCTLKLLVSIPLR